MVVVDWLSVNMLLNRCADVYKLLEYLLYRLCRYVGCADVYKEYLSVCETSYVHM